MVHADDGGAVSDWRNTPQGMRRYREARAAAQKAANEDGHDRGLEAFDYDKTYVVFRLPMARHRFGHELRCEVVSCECPGRTAPEHGYQAHQDALTRAR